MVEILSVGQPCILCERLMEVWTIERDEETGEEQISCHVVTHECEPLKALIRERRAAAPPPNF
jgi:hypothetical protein